MNTSDVLNKAADLIEERGWEGRGDGWYEGNDGAPLCLEGGTMAALGLNYWTVDMDEFRACPASMAVHNYLIYAPGDDLPWHWNDEPNRTAEQVIATLRAAAVIEAARETPSAPTDVRAGTGVGARVGG